jgi:hypothetical protein
MAYRKEFMTHTSLWQQLVTLRDEIKLHAHLLELDMKQHWHALEPKIHAIESAILNKAEQIGKHEEQQFVGTDEEISQLIKELKPISKYLQRHREKHS